MVDLHITMGRKLKLTINKGLNEWMGAVAKIASDFSERMEECRKSLPKSTILEALVGMPKDEQVEAIHSFLCDWACVPDSYVYDLGRVKEAFSVGTMGFEDFTEWDEDRCLEIAEEFVDWLNSEVED